MPLNGRLTIENKLGQLPIAKPMIMLLLKVSPLKGRTCALIAT